MHSVAHSYKRSRYAIDDILRDQALNIRTVKENTKRLGKYSPNSGQATVVRVLFYIQSISRILDKLNTRCLEQNSRSHPYQFTQNDYSISRTLDVSNKFVGSLTVRDNES